MCVCVCVCVYVYVCLGVCVCVALMLLCARRPLALTRMCWWWTSTCVYTFENTHRTHQRSLLLSFQRTFTVSLQAGILRKGEGSHENLRLEPQRSTPEPPKRGDLIVSSKYQAADSFPHARALPCAPRCIHTHTHTHTYT